MSRGKVAVRSRQGSSEVTVRFRRDQTGIRKASRRFFPVPGARHFRLVQKREPVQDRRQPFRMEAPPVWRPGGTSGGYSRQGRGRVPAVSGEYSGSLDRAGSRRLGWADPLPPIPFLPCAEWGIRAPFSARSCSRPSVEPCGPWPDPAAASVPVLRACPSASSPPMPSSDRPAGKGEAPVHTPARRRSCPEAAGSPAGFATSCTGQNANPPGRDGEGLRGP